MGGGSMCLVCKRLKAKKITAEEAEELLEEIQDKIGEDHYDEVTDLIADVYNDEQYLEHSREIIDEVYSDEVKYEERLSRGSCYYENDEVVDFGLSDEDLKYLDYDSEDVDD
jgi:hypothetical protein